MNKLYLAVPLIALLVLLAPPFAVQARGTSGAYKDSAGVVHPWSINAAHVLVWDDRPFVPVGGRFQAKSWASGGR